MTDILSQTISNCSLFAHFDAVARSALVDASSLTRYSDRDIVVREGETVPALYLVATGAVHVSTHALGKEVNLKTLSAGTYFGEVSLMSGKGATATVNAVGDTELVQVSKAYVSALVKTDATLRKLMESTTLNRAKDTLGKVLK